AEVGELHLALDRAEDVRRRDVAMDDVERLARMIDARVRILERTTELLRHVEAVRELELSTLGDVLLEDLLDRQSLHELHCDVVGAIVFGEIEDGDDVL